MKAAERLGKTAAVKERIRQLAALTADDANFVAGLLGRELRLP